MKTKVFWIPGPWRGRLGIMARPRGGDWLDDEATSWRDAGIDVIVSLLEASEVEQFELEREATSAAAVGLDFKSAPIPDRGVPQSPESIESLAADIAKALGRGKNVAVHCRQGIGRSSVVAATALILSGASASDAIRSISSARGVDVPETDAQRKWINDFAMSHAS